MRAYVAMLRKAAGAGFLLGALVGAVPWHRVWPELSLLSAARGAAIGWLLGVGLALLATWALRRRAPAPNARPAGLLRRAFSGGLTAFTFAPILLWCTLPLPAGLLRRAMASGRPAGDTRPNIILVTIDALRADHVGARGLTPNLDAFAREATSYDAAYVSSPWTLPSLGTLFTSLTPSRCVIDPVGESPGESAGYLLADDAPLLSEKLSRAGYATAAELTNHLLAPERGWRRGFDCFRNESAEDSAILDPTRAQHVTERAVEWLRLNRREPFFLWVHYFDPHVPYDAPDTPKELRARYPRYWMAHPTMWLRQVRHQRESTRRQYKEFYRRTYAEEVKYADRWVGELLRQVRAMGLDQRSLIAVTADHGEELFDRPDDSAIEHGHTMHEPVLSVPLLVKWPRGTKADRRITQTVPMAALHWTIAKLARVRHAGGAHHVGLPLHSGDTGAEVFSEWIYYGREHTALTTDHHRVIYWPAKDGGDGSFEVYERPGDRRERHNLAARPVALASRSRLKRLTRAALETRLASRRHAPEGAKLSKKAERDLRALGYLGP